jgi:hypothetical protein
MMMKKAKLPTGDQNYRPKYFYGWGQDLTTECIPSASFEIPMEGQDLSFWSRAGGVVAYNGVYLGDKLLDAILDNYTRRDFHALICGITSARADEDKELIRRRTYYLNGKWVRDTANSELWYAEDGTLDDYLTVIQRDMATDEIIGFRHFVNEEITKSTVDHIKGQIKSAVNEAIASQQLDRTIKGVISESVHSVVNVADSHINRIKKERERLEDEQRKIEKKLAKLQEYEAREAEREANRSSRTRKTDGYVYLVRALHKDDLYKIGRTGNPDDRMRTFSVKLPFAVEYSCLIKTDDMYALESELHTRFARNRVDGEWFTLTDDDVRYIHALAEAA